MSAVALHEELFAGGGETGALMRAIDWADTPLGPVDHWPQSLKTCVRVLLTSRQPMFVWWGDKSINLYNDAYRSILGGKHPRAMGQPAADVWTEIWGQIVPRLASAMNGNTGTYDEALLLIMERNGYPEETYYTFSYSPVPNDTGGPGGIFCANTDDTRRIIGERQLAVLRELAARTADARSLHEVLRLSAEALAIDPQDVPFALIYEGDPEQAHATLAASTGIPGGHPAAPILCTPDAHWPLADAMAAHEPRVVPARAIPGALPTGAWEVPPSQACIVPIAAASAAGRNLWLIAGLNPYRLFDTEYRTFLQMAANQIGASVANAQAYEDERRRAEALAELDRAKTTFFSNISHEFRTPLTLLLAPVEEALRDESMALAGEDLASVHRNAQRLLRLVNALLDFSRIEAGRVQAHYEPVDLARLTAELASVFRSAIEKAGLRLDVQAQALSAPAYVDRDMWEKIVLNLLSNAFKFTFDGDIAVRLRETHDAAVLEVGDTGIGIDAHELPRLFERFHRVQGAQARTHEGSGIGLALVQELVKMHGGHIEVASEPGRGTQFTVTIPLGRAHLPQERIGEAREASVSVGSYVQEAERWLDLPPAPSVQEAGARGSILLADDNADMRDYVRRLLEADGYHVVAVANGREAIAAVQATLPDLVLTDVMMPEIDGFGVARALRDDPRTRALPIVMLSARAGEDARAEGVEGGADDYLVKPFSAKELLARVTLQIERARRRREIERQRTFLNDLFMQAPACIAVLRGPDYVFELANPAYRKLLGDRPIVGRTLREAVPEIEPQGFFDILDEVRRSGEPHVGNEVTSWLDATNSGRLEERIFNYVFQPIRGEGGEVDSIVVFSYLVTEHVRARRRVETLMEQLQIADKRKDEFLAMLAHELRNPLAPVRNAVALLQARGDGDERTRWLLDVMERQTGNLGRLVDDLLDVSRITRGLVVLDRQRVELRWIVERALESVQGLMDEKHHEVSFTAPVRPLVVSGDSVRLEQVLVNLLTNAAKYTDPHGHIAVELRRGPGGAEIRVRDDGIGMEPDTIAHVFDLFGQAERALDRSQGGLGIGLTIVRNLVGLHGGAVDARSEGSERGSEFVVTLPLLTADETPGEADGADGASADKPARRVLVVDDNVDSARTLACLVESLGHAVEIAFDGPSALEAARASDPELVLLDVGLPGMSGYDVVRALREDVRTRAARIVAVTGYGQYTDRQAALDAGFDRHLIKPVPLDALHSLLAEPR